MIKFASKQQTNDRRREMHATRYLQPSSIVLSFFFVVFYDFFWIPLCAFVLWHFTMTVMIILRQPTTMTTKTTIIPVCVAHYLGCCLDIDLYLTFGSFRESSAGAKINKYEEQTDVLMNEIIKEQIIRKKNSFYPQIVIKFCGCWLLDLIATNWT